MLKENTLGARHGQAAPAAKLLIGQFVCFVEHDAQRVALPQIARISTIAQEARVKVAPPLYTDALGKPGTAGETYLKMMRYNVDTIVAALK